MLVLSRRCDTAIHIGCNIKVTILSIRKGEVRLGIDAPRDIPIWRDELCRADPTLMAGASDTTEASAVADGMTVHESEAPRFKIHELG